MTLTIGTILIAKEDVKMNDGSSIAIIKGNEYKIKDLILDVFIIKSELFDIHEFDIEDLDKYFTIKRYTLSDLQTRTDLMVRIDNKEQANKLQDAGIEFDYKTYYGPYYGLAGIFMWLNKSEQQGRILLESIDEIDLGDEVKETKVVEIDHLKKLESEISRLKGELAELETALRVTTKKLGDATSQDLEKRERMAWEIYVHDNNQTSMDRAFEVVDQFLAKSKEVKNDD